MKTTLPCVVIVLQYSQPRKCIRRTDLWRFKNAYVIPRFSAKSGRKQRKVRAEAAQSPGGSSAKSGREQLEERSQPLSLNKVRVYFLVFGVRYPGCCYAFYKPPHIFSEVEHCHHAFFIL